VTEGEGGLVAGGWFVASGGNRSMTVERVELLPTRLAELGDGAVIKHDLNVYSLVVDLGEQERTSILRPRGRPS
jgi:hypothetical protein